MHYNWCYLCYMKTILSLCNNRWWSWKNPTFPCWISFMSSFFSSWVIYCSCTDTIPYSSWYKFINIEKEYFSVIQLYRHIFIGYTNATIQLCYSRTNRYKCTLYSDSHPTTRPLSTVISKLTRPSDIYIAYISQWTSLMSHLSSMSFLQRSY